MSSLDIAGIVTVIAVWTAVMFGPMFLADMAFKKRNRKIAWAVCYLISGLVWMSTGIIMLTYGNTASAENVPLIIFITAYFIVMGLAWISWIIWEIRSEFLHRRKVRAETLF